MKKIVANFLLMFPHQTLVALFFAGFAVTLISLILLTFFWNKPKYHKDGTIFMRILLNITLLIGFFMLSIPYWLV